MKKPCNFDHNGECLICDCWSGECAYMRMLNKDYKYESKEELEEMFNNELTDYENLVNNKYKQLYSEIETLIIMWNNDGTKTAGSLTREIIKLVTLDLK